MIRVVKIFFILLLLFLNSGVISQNKVVFLANKINLPYSSSITRFEKNTIYATLQEGVITFNGKSTKKVPFGNSIDSLLETGNSNRLVYNDYTRQLVCCYPKWGIGILNRNNRASYFQILQITGLNPNDEVSGFESVEANYIVCTKNRVFVFTIGFNSTTRLYYANVIQQIVFDTDNILGLCKTKNRGFAIITSRKYLINFETGESGAYKENLRRQVPMLNSVKEIFAFRSKNKNYFVGTGNGLFRISEIDSTQNITKNYLEDQAVYNICHVYDGSIYIASSNGLYLLNNLGHLSEIEEANNQGDKSFLSTVYDIYADSNKVWLASQEGIAMFNHHGSPFYSVTKKDDFKPNHVYQICENRNGDITFSCENGFYSFGKNRILTATKKEDTHFLSAKTPDGSQLVSTINHTYVHIGNSVVSVEKKYPEFKGYEGLSFNDFEFMDDGEMILSTENEQGVYKWNFRSKTFENIEKQKGGQQVRQVNNLYKKGNTIFILTDNYVYSYSDGNLNKHVVLKGQKTYGLFFDMAAIKNKFYLTSYDNGVLETDSSFRVLRNFNTSNGLSDNGVYRLAPIGDSLLLVSTNNGLNAVNLRGGRIKYFTEEDGLHSNVFEEFSSYQKDGKSYFGGKDGFTIVNTEKMDFSISLFNNLHFTECVQLDDKNISSTIELGDTSKISFSNKITQVTISFFNLIYPYRERIRYEYKITELHNYWIDLGGQTSVTLPVVSRGTYHLQVRSANEDGVWSEPKELILIFEPKWYQTWWFYALIALTAAGILYALYRYRISQIKKQHEIRRNIANDLHDDLGSTLNSVKVFTNLAISGVNQNESLQQVKQNLNEATTGLRDMLWVLDDSLDTTDEMVTRLKQYALPVSAASEIELSVKTKDDAGNSKLSKEEKRNLYLICKEAINNSIKYSGCNSIEVVIEPHGKKIGIIITDNGKGFDTGAVKAGYGLKNMQYRARQVKYEANINSQPGDGTRVTILPQ